MIYKKSMGIVFLIFFSLLSTNADVLTWRASADQEFEAKVTIKESVTGLDSITVRNRRLLPLRRFRNRKQQKIKVQYAYTSTESPRFPKMELIPDLPGRKREQLTTI